MEDTQETLGRNLEAARQAADPVPSYNTLSREIFAEKGRGPTGQTIMQYHKGRVRMENVDAVLIAWLAVRYGVSVGDLSPTIAQYAAADRSVLARSRWDSVPAGRTPRGARSSPSTAAAA